jgi:hypothetical protein
MMISSTIFLRLSLAFLLLCPLTLAQDQRRQIAQREQLRKLMSRVDVDVPENEARANQPQTYRELKLNWADSAKSTVELRTEAQTQIPRVSIVEDRKRAGTLPRQRSLELAPTLMFVAAVDASNKLRWWSIMPDPRVVRAETQTATGELRSQDYYVSNVTVVVAFPDDPEIATLRFYHPAWNGTDFELKPLTVVSTR